jgi:hypothetical protein
MTSSVVERHASGSWNCGRLLVLQHVDVSDETITARLVDGRVISVPLAWSWRLSEATPAQRANWHLIGNGHGVHWPDFDEDISAEGMLGGGRPLALTAPDAGRHARPARCGRRQAGRRTKRARGAADAGRAPERGTRGQG